MIFEVPLEHLPQGASCSRPITSYNRASPPRMKGLTRQNSISGSGLHMTRSARPLVSLTLATATLLHHSLIVGGYCRSKLDRYCGQFLRFGSQSTNISYSMRFWRQLRRTTQEFGFRR
uniref:Uncharacterized protein n=1 Tax=Plectus sambesii TaxID=2011161 RepID=A0A914W5R0_9BILA